MKIAITAESTIDLTKELLEKYDIKTLPFTVILGDNEYKDGEITSSDIFKFVEEVYILQGIETLISLQLQHFVFIIEIDLVLAQYHHGTQSPEGEFPVIYSDPVAIKPHNSAAV